MEIIKLESQVVLIISNNFLLLLRLLFSLRNLTFFSLERQLSFNDLE